MKERRLAGATHSFRLTREAATIVDNINHPRRQGGKSRKVSDAIEWYFHRPDEEESLEEVKASRQFWVERYDALVEEIGSKNLESRPQPPTWWRRILQWFGWKA